MKKQKRTAKAAWQALSDKPKLEAEIERLKAECSKHEARADDAEKELADLKLMIEKAKQTRAKEALERKNARWWKFW